MMEEEMSNWKFLWWHLEEMVAMETTSAGIRKKKSQNNQEIVA